MKKKRVLKLNRETLLTLDKHALGDAQGGILTAVCSVKCPSGTICSCGQTEISCWDSCITC
ncbi:MAG: hypothetical protein QOH06_3684 [Acidobacteriota bacterium]|jgi:hypothetical protein|nr:hypothetical protein [Acidobacteriota bacterium]